MSGGWKFWVVITTAVAVGVMHAFYEATNEYLKDQGDSK